MGMSIKSKFEKYWGDPTKMNTLIFLANIFDPRDKIEFMEYTLKQMYGDDTGLAVYIILKSDPSALFDEYVLLYGNIFCGSNYDPTVSVDSSGQSLPGKSMSLLKEKFKKHKMEIGGTYGNKKSELESYTTPKRPGF